MPPALVGCLNAKLDGALLGTVYLTRHHPTPASYSTRCCANQLHTGFDLPHSQRWDLTMSAFRTSVLLAFSQDFPDKKAWGTHNPEMAAEGGGVLPTGHEPPCENIQQSPTVMGNSSINPLNEPFLLAFHSSRPRPGLPGSQPRTIPVCKPLP